jgi:hypothetical protein
MSFDVFLQGFAAGEAAPGDPEAARRLLAPYAASPPVDGFVQVRTGDGEASVYGYGEDHLMVNHASGREIWDVLVRVAREARWAIMPTGCPTCVTDESMRSDLPAVLRGDAVVVATGADLVRAFDN